MRNQNSELDAFKREIDLREFAVSLGYEIDRHESWRGSTVLRRDADKIVVKRHGNGHYVFFSVRDDRDNGTVIDLLQRRRNRASVRCVRSYGLGSADLRSSRSLPNWSLPVRIGCVSKARTGAWQTHSGFRTWNTRAVCPRQCCYRRGLRAACGSTPSATRYFPISMPRGCADTRSRIVDSPALPPGAKRGCGCRIPSRPTGVWS